MTTFTTVTVLLLASSTAIAGQTRESLSSAATRIAREIAISRPAPSQSRGRDDWNKLRRLPEVSVVRVEMRDGSLKDGQLGYIADDRIVLLTAGALPPDAREALLFVAKTQPSLIGRKAFRHKGLTVENGAIVVNGIRVGDVDSVFTDVPRDAIAEIKRPVHGSLLGGVLGAAAGGVVGVLLALNFAFREDGGTLMMVSLVGSPVAGAVIGYRSAPHSEWATVYRRR